MGDRATRRQRVTEKGLREVVAAATSISDIDGEPRQLWYVGYGIHGPAAHAPDGWDNSAEANQRKALRLVAKTPTLLAMYHRMRTGQEIVLPNPKLPHAGNFLAMLIGEEPSPEDADALDATLTPSAD